MKHLVLAVIVVLVGVAVAATSCSPMAVVGSGDIVTRNEEFTGFDRLEIGYAFHATIRQGDSYEVAIRVDDNLVDYLDVRQTGQTVHIGFEPGTMISHGTMEVDITMPELVSLDLSGAGDGTISGFDSDNAVTLNLSGASTLEGDIQSGDMRLEASGASRADLTGSAGDVRVNASGASKVYLDGSARDLTAEASGASTVDLSKLTVRDARLNASGASEISVDASGRLDADASGGSHIYYTGNPTMGNIETSGASAIKSK